MKSLIFLFSFFLSSCAQKTVSSYYQSQQAIKISQMEQDRLYKKVMDYWDKRHLKEQLEEMLPHLERLALSIKKDQIYQDKSLQEYYTWLARGYYLLADAHHTDIEKKKIYWEIGSSWGERALNLNADFAKHATADSDWKKALRSLEKKDVPAIYWTMSNWGKWAKLSGISDTLKYKDRIKNMNERVMSLDEKFFYGAAHRYLGSYYAVTPSFAGGDMNKSFIHFKKAMNLGNEYLGTQNLYAKFYLIKKGQRQKFIETLSAVLATPLNEKSDIYSENIIEKKKSQDMLTRVDELFD